MAPSNHQTLNHTRNSTTLPFPVRKPSATPYRERMDTTTQATYKTSEVARQLGVSAERLRKGEERGFFPPARRPKETTHD